MRRVMRQRLDALPVRLEQRDLLVDGRGVTYGLLVPRTAPPDTGYPLILALHYGTTQEPGLSPYFGVGYVGQLVLPALESLGAVIVAPDAPEASWAHPGSDRAVLAVLDTVAKELALDARQSLVTGFSMGGQGAYYMAAAHPDRFRAAIPMAALPVVAPADSPDALKAAQAATESDTAWTAALAKTPLYVIHSRADQVVPFERAERAVRALQTSGAAVQFAPVDDVPHALISGYIDPLAAAVPWVRETWARTKR